jgi:hypothetical protein
MWNDMKNIEENTVQSTHWKVTVHMLTYASENQAIYQSDKRKIESDEARFLCPVAGYNLINQKLNTDVH